MTPDHLRLGFAGTPDIAARILQQLIDAGHQPECVLTQPDRPAGRGRKLQASAVKRLADQQGIPVFQPADSTELLSITQLASLDILVVVAYGLLLPTAVLEKPRSGCMNVHMSLLPRWRGAAPIQRAIEAGDTTSGVTVMQMDAGLDTGPILAQLRYALQPGETSASLYDKLASLGGKCLLNVLSDTAAGKLQAVVQDESKATYARKISKQEAEIDWQQPATVIERKIRAFNPSPVACTEFRQQGFRIWQASVLHDSSVLAPGSIIQASAEGVDIATAEGALRLLQIQPAGKRVMTIREFINGHPEFFQATIR